MTIESNLERIAAALEMLVGLKTGAIPLPPVQPVVMLGAMPVATAEVPQPGQSEQREWAPRPRGRPRKDAAQAVSPMVAKVPEDAAALEAATPVEESVENFLDVESAAPEKATLDDVRKALSDLAQRKGGGDDGRKAAYKVLETVGKAQRLPGSPADQKLGGNAPGALKETEFQAVIDAARKA